MLGIVSGWKIGLELVGVSQAAAGAICELSIQGTHLVPLGLGAPAKQSWRISRVFFPALIFLFFL